MKKKEKSRGEKKTAEKKEGQQLQEAENEWLYLKKQEKRNFKQWQHS